MLRYNAAKKGVVLLIVLATLLVVIVLVGVILGIISNQSSLTTHQLSRIKAYYAAKGMMVYAMDMLRQGIWKADSTNKKYACHRSCTVLGVASPDYTIPTDGGIPYNVLVTIYPLNHADINLVNGSVTQLNIKIDYTYTPF